MNIQDRFTRNYYGHNYGRAPSFSQLYGVLMSVQDIVCMYPGQDGAAADCFGALLSQVAHIW